MIGRRTFLQRTAGAAALAGIGDLAFLSRLPRVSAAEAKTLFAPLVDVPALVLAVSGGPDSTALLMLAAAPSAKAEGTFDIPAGAHFNPKKLEKIGEFFPQRDRQR